MQTEDEQKASRDAVGRKNVRLALALFAVAIGFYVAIFFAVKAS